MTGRRPLAVWLALCIAGALCARAEQVPGRVDPLRRPGGDFATLVLWHFDGKDARDGGALENAGRLLGGAKVGPDGRFGGALALTGGGSAAVLSTIKGLHMPKVAQGEQELSLDFWFRFEKAPGAAQCLFELASSADAPAVRLDLEPGGKLSLSGLGVEKGTSAEAVPAGEWAHVAVIAHTEYWSSGAGHAGIFVKGTGVAALLNGRIVVKALTERPYHRFPPGTLKDRFALGNNLALNAGFVGRVDEFHLSGTGRLYYPVVRQTWLDPQGARPVERPHKFFRKTGKAVFHEPFDGEATLKKLCEKNKCRAVKPEALADGSLHKDLLRKPKPGDLDEGEGLEDLFSEDKYKGPGALGLEPGAKGEALFIKGLRGGATVPVPDGVDLTSGTVEFLFKPGDWGNLHTAKRDVSYENSRLNLLTLYGKPNEGEGEPVRLLAVRVDRLRSSKVPPGFDLMPHKWMHVALVWGEGVKHYQPNYYVDGVWVGWDMRHSVASVAKPDVWAKHAPAYFKLGDFMEASYDELRIYDKPWTPLLVANAYAEYSGGKMEEMTDVACSFSYRLAVGKMVVGLTINLEDAAKVASARVEFDLPHAKRTVTGTTTALGNAEGGVELDVGELPEGDYPCRCVLLDAAGGEIARVEKAFTRAHVPWLHNELGLTDTPPPPFTPISVKNGTVSCVLRAYSVAPDGLFEAIRVKDEGILAAPMHFRLVRNGQEVPFKAAGAAQFGPANAVEAAWKGVAEAPGVRISTSARLEYDGMAKFTLDLEPTDGPVSVDRLSLNIPLDGTYGHYLHALPMGGDFRNYETSRYLPADDGVLWDSLNGFKGKPIYKQTVGNFIPMVWLGGRVRGICWFADNDRGWVPHDEHPAVTIAREKDVVTVALNLISAPYELKAPRRIVFGLLGTPSKPVPEDYRLWNRGNNEKVGVIGGPLTSCDAFRPWRLCPRENCFDYWPKDYDWAFAEQCVKNERRFRPDAALLVYTDKAWGPIGKDGAYFAWEWKSGPRSQWCWTPSLINCWLWYMDNYIGRGIYNGLYIDDTFPTTNFNTQTGSAYLLDDGRMQPGVSFFGFREYLKRLRNVFHSHGRRSLISIHMTSTIIYPALSFADLVWDGEDSGRFHSKKLDFLDVWPLERMHVLDNPERSGLVTLFMFKSQYPPLASGSPAHIDHSFRAAYAGRFLHDFVLRSTWKGTERGQPCLQVVNEYKGREVTFHPYWKNDDLLTVEAKIEEPLPRDQLPRSGGRWRWSKEYLDELARNPIKASLWRKSDGVLIVAVNFARKPLLGSIKLDLDALGVPKDKRALLRMTDRDNWPPLPEEFKKGPPEIGEDKGGEDAGGLLDEIKQEQANKDRFRPAKGEMDLMVLPHDFRLIEVRWDEAQ